MWLICAVAQLHHAAAVPARRPADNAANLGALCYHYALCPDGHSLVHCGCLMLSALSCKLHTKHVQTPDHHLHVGHSLRRIHVCCSPPQPSAPAAPNEPGTDDHQRCSAGLSHSVVCPMGIVHRSVGSVCFRFGVGAGKGLGVGNQELAACCCCCRGNAHMNSPSRFYAMECVDGLVL